MDIPEAVRQADAGSGESTMDERSEARPEGPHPRSSAEHDPDEEIGAEVEEQLADEEDAWDLIGWLQDTPEGSYRDMDARQYWDPDGGGKNRLAHHLSDRAGTTGIPNGIGILLALAEMYYNLAQQQDTGSSEDGGDGSGDGFPEIEESAI